jgi:hypothetical protein
MEGNLVQTFLNVLIIEQISSKILKKCVTKNIMQGRSPFLESRKMGFKKVHSKN